MIRKLRRRYLITNMAILSCTLLVGLTVLFGLLYHSEVESSYTVMQEMLHESAAPGQMPPGSDFHEVPPDSNGEHPAPPQDENAIEPSAMTENGTVSPMAYTYATTMETTETTMTETTASLQEDADDAQSVAYCGEWEDPWCWYQQYFNDDMGFFQPPYWDFMDPENQWQNRRGHEQRKDDEDENEADDAYDNPGQNPDDRMPPEMNDPPEPQMSESQNSQQSSASFTTTTTTVTSQSTGSSAAGTRQMQTQPMQTSGSSQAASSNTSSQTQSNSALSSSSTTSKSAAASSSSSSSASTGAAVAATVITTSSKVEVAATTETTTTTSALVPVDEGHFVPDALIAQIGDDGSIESYAGNDVDGSDEDHMRTVHHAMDEVKARGNHAGTIQIDDTSYRYLYQTDASGASQLVLLDRTLEISTLSRLLLLFFFITILGLIGMFILSMLLANWTVTPIAAAWEKQKQFVADASHELKTPLAVISANTEVVLANPQESVAGSSKWLNYIQSETMRMSNLITNLLSVARMDQNTAIREKSAVISLSEIVSNTCMVFDPIVFEHGKTLNSVIQKNVMLHAEEDNVKQLLSILLDNAVLHSVPKAQITVSLSQDAQGKIRLAVANTAKDIPQEQLAHLFDRFYRVDTEGSPNGSGLGLSIAKSIVHQIGGTLTVTSENHLVTFLAVLS